MNQLSLIRHAIRFCKTLNVLFLPLVFWALVEVWVTAGWVLTPIGLVLAVVAYYFSEALTHRQMHLSRWSPFYSSHWIHHQNPTPETGVPKDWLFMIYFLVMAGVSYLERPVVSGMALGLVLMLGTYEWVHFLCHCRYRPKTRWGWRVRINHLQHHNFPTTRYEMLFLKRK